MGSASFIVTECCDDKDLKQMIPHMNDQEKLTCIVQVLEGLKVLHKQGYVHRDLKAANILKKTNATGRVTYKIADFGAAIKVGEKNQTVHKNYTSIAHAPKHFMEKLTDRKSPILLKPGMSLVISRKLDIYSMGVIIGKMFGLIPVRSTDKWIVHRQTEPVEPSDPVQKDVRTIFAGCIKEDDNARFTVDQLLNRIQMIQQILKRKHAKKCIEALTNKSPLWQKDKPHKICQECDKPFGSFLRIGRSRHHCRICGHVICKDCSTGRKQMLVKSCLGGTSKKKSVRICNSCKQ